MRFLLCLVFAILVSPCLAGPGDIEKVSLPKEVAFELKSLEIPKEIEGKVWNRWTTDNFVVCSLDDKQAQYLHRHLEQVKGWVYSRWGLSNMQFSAECKIICVNDPILFEKMFHIKKTRAEVRRDESGRIAESIIFMLINDSPSRTVPIPLTEVCLAEFAQKYNDKFGWWAYRGMSLLNGSIDQIRARLFDLGPVIRENKPFYFSESLLGMTEKAYDNLDDRRQDLFDKSAMAFCLLVRKELGQNVFHRLLKTTSQSGGEAGIKDVLKFDGYRHFDKTFKRYMIDLTGDLSENKTPDHYLQIRPAGD
jgi:hypothetical protein